MYDLIEYIRNDHRTECSIIPIRDGICIVRYRGMQYPKKEIGADEAK